ncbi:MAG: 16S rRNA (guanine(966)-N(2))-methyltransferase RsmD [Moraxella sp.]|nr:16S rRNA (guanine(966)-N(2))-methyltransferase RsmD [Moraxella sp.]
MASKAKAPSPISQVRIIGGKFKRRQVSFLDIDGLRPTPDRLRETIFNWLMADILDARVLDVCAGSGVLGFEALSRGASFVALIEPNPKQFAQLERSAQALNINSAQIQLIGDTAQRTLSTFDKPFDVIFIDPPYALNLWQELLKLLIDHRLCHDHTLIYIESNQPLDDILTPFCATVLNATKVGQVYASIINLSSG